MRLSLVLAALIVAAPVANSSIIFTIENAGVQQTTVPGAVTENFDDGNLSSPIGTFSSGAVALANQYGGAGGSGYYFRPGTTSILSLATPQNYFGLWWSAGDSNNTLTFLDASSNVLGTFTIADIIPLLSPNYYGNPNANFLGQNSIEPYAYLNFTVSGGAPISSVAFGGGSTFELDNISVFANVITPPGNPTRSVPDGGASGFLLGLSLSGVAWLRRRV